MFRIGLRVNVMLHGRSILSPLSSEFQICEVSYIGKGEVNV